MSQAISTSEPQNSTIACLLCCEKETLSADRPDPLGQIIAMDRDEGKTSSSQKGGSLRIGINRAP
jgi:hypothetical protein